MSTRLLAGAAVPVLVLVLAACGGNEHEGHTAAEHSSALASSAPAASTTPASASSAGASAGQTPAGSTGAAAAPTGPAAATTGSGTGAGTGFNQQDVSFAQNMIMHHRQAIDLAALAEGRTSTAAVQRLAAAVTGSQAPEVDQMTRWLSSWGAAVPEDMSQMDMAGSMPGMQSLAAMQAVAELEGTAFDRQFLTMMKDHHEGAITMAKQELSGGGNADAKALAARVIVAQSAELDLIAGLLK